MKITLALLTAGWLVIAGCGGEGGGSSGAGGNGGSAGSSGAAGTSGGGTTGTAGTSGGGTTGTAGSAAAGTGGTTGNAGAGGRGGSAGSVAGSGGAGSGGTGGSAGSAGGTAGRGGTGGSTGGGSGGNAGRGGSGGGAAGRGGSGGNAGGGGVAGRGGSGGNAGGGGIAGAITNPRIMPLGDSTTASICYRALLWQMLTQAGRTPFNFVGTRNGDPGCGVSGYDRDNEGHGGYIVTDVLKAAGSGQRPGGADSSDPYVSDARDLATWFDGKPADIVMMHFGTNDVWNNIAPATILQAYTTILGRLRGANPNVRVLVAQIISLQPSGCNDCPTRVQTLNAMIPGWATANSTAASPITVVDQNTGFNPATDTVSDGVHPNTSGSTKIAAKWFNVVSPMIAP